MGSLTPAHLAALAQVRIGNEDTRYSDEYARWLPYMDEWSRASPDRLIVADEVFLVRPWASREDPSCLYEAVVRLGIGSTDKTMLRLQVNGPVGDWSVHEDFDRPLDTDPELTAHQYLVEMLTEFVHLMRQTTSDAEDDLVAEDPEGDVVGPP